MQKDYGKRFNVPLSDIELGFLMAFLRTHWNKTIESDIDAEGQKDMVIRLYQRLEGLDANHAFTQSPEDRMRELQDKLANREQQLLEAVDMPDEARRVIEGMIAGYKEELAKLQMQS